MSEAGSSSSNAQFVCWACGRDLTELVEAARSGAPDAPIVHVSDSKKVAITCPQDGKVNVFGEDDETDSSYQVEAEPG